MTNSHSPEKLRSVSGSSETPKTKAEAEKVKSKEVKEKTSELLDTTGIEAVEAIAGVELGKTAETAGEGKAAALGAGFPPARSADEIEAIRAKLLAALPPQEVMVKQIRKTLYRQEKILTKRMRKFQKKAHLHAFQLAVVVAQLRKVREYFSLLARATYEMIKHLWLKIVHGV